ncbi:uncharacterized protein LOC124362531 isoform X1 [Homalodisca vitripennis]|uniref:uncharacterized protein LOC124362531 isoform X1 n=1 Tax=Homalodisca vitripennis TaxID=197043 RepID=UPI001EEBB9E4|nr:uncharacterized protein LOC124362531 isoform X1 [Homalodisca vitripennis]
MFIGRVYENQKKNKQASNASTYSEHTMKKRGRSRSVSDDETDEDPPTVKGNKNTANIKTRKTVVHDSPLETDRDSEPEEHSKEAKKASYKEGGEKSFMERINEKVKKLKKDKDTKETKVNGFSGETKQVVYSIPAADVEKGVKKGKPEKSYAKDKFDSIELDSADEKRSVEEEGGMKSIGIQAIPYPPFRLRLLPHPDWQESETTLLKVMRLVLCQCGLACIVLTWALIGALVFHLTEAPREYSQVIEMNRRQTELVVGLATDLRQVVPEEPVWRTTIEQYATHHEALILSAVSSGYPQRGTIWTYCGCLLFATSLLTTLGFGAPVPRTVTGRICAIVFAGVGIPVHLLLVLNVGLLLAVKLHHLSRVSQRKLVRLHRQLTNPKSQEEDWPEDIFTPDDTPPPPPSWIKFFPFVAIPVYYCLGLLLFGVFRDKTFPEVLLFPLDFTAAGGVASRYGPLRVAYAAYLEGAVILASTNVALLRVTATRGFTTLGIKLGLMINSHK